MLTDFWEAAHSVLKVGEQGLVLSHQLPFEFGGKGRPDGRKASSQEVNTQDSE